MRAGSSETLVPIYRITNRHIPKYRHRFRNNRQENLTRQIFHLLTFLHISTHKITSLGYHITTIDITIIITSIVKLLLKHNEKHDITITKLTAYTGKSNTENGFTSRRL
jgi:hypothetical protein